MCFLAWFVRSRTLGRYEKIKTPVFAPDCVWRRSTNPGGPMQRIHRYFGLASLALCLFAPVGIQARPVSGLSQERHEDRDHDRDRDRDDHQYRRYYDSQYRQYRVWNPQEQRAYQHWLQERNERYRDFEKAKRKQQQEYWKWRHDHQGQTWERR
jgi:hypothetical protein